MALCAMASWQLDRMSAQISGSGSTLQRAALVVQD
jgi:hypothetical protein